MLIDQHADLFVELYSAVLGEAVTFDGPTERWIIWPARPNGHETKEAELRARGVRVVGYTEVGESYRFSVGNGLVAPPAIL